MTLTKAIPHFGMSRSAFYRAAAKKQLRLMKMGKTTLVDAASVRAYLAGLPTLTPKGAA